MSSERRQCADVSSPSISENPNSKAGQDSISGAYRLRSQLSHKQEPHGHASVPIDQGNVQQAFDAPTCELNDIQKLQLKLVATVLCAWLWLFLILIGMYRLIKWIE